MPKRHNRKGRSNGGGPFVPVLYSMARHEAFRSLSGSALKVLFELRSRYIVRGDGSNNNGEITLSLDEAAKLLGLGKATVQRALNELIETGFVKLTKRGQWYGRRASEYAVTDCPLDGKPPTRDWQSGPFSDAIKKQNSVPRPTMFERDGTIRKPMAQ